MFTEISIVSAPANYRLGGILEAYGQILDDARTFFHHIFQVSKSQLCELNFKLEERSRFNRGGCSAFKRGVIPWNRESVPTVIKSRIAQKSLLLTLIVVGPGCEYPYSEIPCNLPTHYLFLPKISSIIPFIKKFQENKLLIIADVVFVHSIV